jgi:hypothetical protein
VQWHMWWVAPVCVVVPVALTVMPAVYPGAYGVSGAWVRDAGACTVTPLPPPPPPWPTPAPHHLVSCPQCGVTNKYPLLVRARMGA